jgi:hypothetical protein
METLHKINFLANTYQPKYQTISSLLLSILCELITIIFALYTCYSELYTRSISNIAYMGMQKYEKESLNETFQVNLDFDFSLMPFYCNYFYVNSNENKVTYFSINNTSINQTISLTQRNYEGYFYSLKVYVHCNVNELRNYYTDVKYNVTFNYEVSRADYLDPLSPFKKEKVSKTYFTTLGDKNEKNMFDYDNLKSLKMNEFKFDYVYYRILDDLNWFKSGYNTEEYVHNLEKITRMESYKSSPTENTENLLFFKFSVDHNDSEVVLVKRKFLKIPEISSKILGIFSLVKFISKFFLKFAYYHSKKIFLLNTIFETKITSTKTGEVSLLESGSNNLSYDIKKETINGETKFRRSKKFNYFDNLKFSCCIKTKQMKLEYYLMRSVSKKLKESSSLPNLMLSLFLLKNNYEFSYLPKLKIYPDHNTYSMKYNKFDGTVNLIEEAELQKNNMSNLSSTLAH